MADCADQLPEVHTSCPAVHFSWVGACCDVARTYILYKHAQQPNVIMVTRQFAEALGGGLQDLLELGPAGLCAVLILSPFDVPAESDRHVV